jgi:two-component system LytT family response regulator
MKIKCIAVDDEPLALRQISDYIKKTAFLDLVASFSNAIEAKQFLEENQPDVIFLDINMPEMNGMELAKNLLTDIGIVFTTAYSQYALESYQVSAIDYLLKPISYPDFLKSATKVEKYVGQARLLASMQESPVDYRFFKADGQLVKVMLRDIIYIESMSEYVRIHLENQRPVVTLMSMKNLETTLPADLFMRVHRSYIINLRKIVRIEKNKIFIIAEKSVPLSDQYKNDFKLFVENNLK